MQEVFEKERETLNAKLQSRPGDSDLGPYCSLLERPEKVIQEQGDLQEKAQEHLHLPARSSLLSEIQALRAQLRRTHLQNQEKLQQLCAALTSAEARGSRREHQLRRQGGCHYSCCFVRPGPTPSPNAVWGRALVKFGCQIL